MMTLELSNDERDLLASLIQEELEEIGPEIRHTQGPSYRESLRDRREVARRLAEKLGIPVSTHA